jgi:hypothetical protein
MSDGPAGARIGDANRGDRNGVAPLGAADRLGLAATPAFALMAVLTAAHGGGPSDLLCGAVHDASPLSGMTMMYALMSVFHSPLWLKLIANRRGG